jgi:hypothetical protein
MIAREIRFKTKRTSRRVTSARTTSFRTRTEPQSHPAFGLPDSFQAWLSDGSAKQIDQFYSA